MENFFDEFSKNLKPINVHFEELIAWENSVFGYDSGVMVLKAEKTNELALFYYDKDEIKPGTYYCYKRVTLK